MLRGLRMNLIAQAIFRIEHVLNSSASDDVAVELMLPKKNSMKYNECDTVRCDVEAFKRHLLDQQPDKVCHDRYKTPMIANANEETNATINVIELVAGTI